MQFNEYLKSCRENHHLTQEELVQKLYNSDDSFEGLDIGTLSRWERGATRPTADRQKRIIKIFQDESDTIFPCFSTFNLNKIEDEICMVGMHNLIGKNSHLIYNVPSYKFEIENMKITHVRNANDIDHILQTPHALYKGITENLVRLDIEHFKAWALHPSNLFLICEYENQFFGMLFTLRLKPASFHKLLNLEIDPKDLSDDDFASFDEVGCNFIISFLAYNNRSASLLFLRYYAHLIANQSVISEVGAMGRIEGGKRLIKRLKLRHHKDIKFSGVPAASYCAPLSDVLINEDVLKMVFQKQECPEDKS